MNHRVEGLALGLLLALGGCGDDTTVVHAPPADGGVANAMPAAPCNADEAKLPLQLISDYAVAFHHVASQCASLATTVLLKNTGTSALQLDELGVSPSEFSAHAEHLSRELTAGAYLGVKLGFTSKTVQERSGTLTLRGTQGCSEFAVHGQAVNDSLTSASASALDFGDTQLGEHSAPQTFELLFQGDASATMLSFDGFGASPAAFQLSAAPVGPITPADCQRFMMQVAFVAPTTPGGVEGSLGYESSSTLDGTTYFGLSEVLLFGNAVSP